MFVYFDRWLRRYENISTNKILTILDSVISLSYLRYKKGPDLNLTPQLTSSSYAPAGGLNIA